MKRKLSEAQILLGKHLEELGFTSITFEWTICFGRRWRADICATAPKPWTGMVLFECDGGKWHGGHRRGNALEKDYERQNYCQINGYKILRFTNEQVLTGQAKEFLEKYL